MNAKNLLSMVLLLFVGAAIVVLIVREVGSDAAQTAPVVEEDVSLPTTGLVAYYFHGETRCPTCRNIEAYAHEAIQGSFPAELSSGEVAWRVVNYELPANAHFATEYEIVSPTVVLVRLSEGQQTDWRNLMRVWELVGDKVAFAEYLQEQAKDLLTKTEG
jgi:hypothetical protein